MSDGMSEAFKMQALERDYEKRLSFIRAAALPDLCAFYKISPTSDPVQLATEVEAFQLRQEYNHFYHQKTWALTFRIPGAFSWTESFTALTLEEVCTRMKAYLTWAQTDLGQKAIANYLDH